MGDLHGIERKNKKTRNGIPEVLINCYRRRDFEVTGV